jgi:hypothetical protein
MRWRRSMNGGSSSSSTRYSTVGNGAETEEIGPA